MPRRNRTEIGAPVRRPDRPLCGGPASPQAGGLAAGEEILDSTDDHLGFEWFHENTVASDRTRARFVDRFERAGEQHDGDVRQRGVAFDERRHVVAITFRHPDVGQHDVRAIPLGSLDRLLAVAYSDDLHVLVRKRKLDDALDRDAVIGQQQLVGHGYMIP